MTQTRPLILYNITQSPRKLFPFITFLFRDIVVWINGCGVVRRALSLEKYRITVFPNFLAENFIHITPVCYPLYNATQISNGPRKVKNIIMITAFQNPAERKFYILAHVIKYYVTLLEYRVRIFERGRKYNNLFVTT